MKIDYVIPNYENPKLLEQCINSIRKYSDGEIIVCDDNSSSYSLSEIDRIVNSFQRVRLMTNFWNSGFGYNCNMGIASSNADVVVLVNSDIELTQNIEKEITTVMRKDEDITVMGFLLYYPNGLIQHGGHKVSNAGYRFLDHRDYQKEKKDAVEALQSGYILSVTGALFAIRKKAFNKIGGFKKEYKLGSEDAEYCYRTWHTGGKVYYSANVSAIHHEGFTRGRTNYEKQVRNTFNDERQTLDQFCRDISIYDFNEIERLVKKAKGEQVPNRIRRIGVNREGALGDVVLATGVINELKRRNPDKEIYVSTLCPFPFVANTNVKRIFTNKKQMIEQVDEYIDLDLAYEKEPKKPVIEAYADVVFPTRDYNFNSVRPTLTSIIEVRDNIQKFLEKNTKGKVAVIHAGYGFWTMKHWSKAKYTQVAMYLKSLGYDVISVGAGSDFAIPDTIDLVGKLQLQEVFELINMSDLFVGIDGGIAHIAACTETPAIVIYSVADPKAFVWRWENTIVVDPKTDCKFCRNKVQPPVTGVICEYGDNHCIEEIEADEVIAAINILLAGGENVTK